jgi:hypothetical protein
VPWNGLSTTSLPRSIDTQSILRFSAPCACFLCSLFCSVFSTWRSSVILGYRLSTRSKTLNPTLEQSCNGLHYTHVRTYYHLRITSIPAFLQSICIRTVLVPSFIALFFLPPAPFGLYRPRVPPPPLRPTYCGCWNVLFRVCVPLVSHPQPTLAYHN